MVSDFSSSEYWSTRFEKERSFEWLASSKALGPVVLDLVKELVRSRSSVPAAAVSAAPKRPIGPNEEDPPINILHFGCGTSTLGPYLARLLQTEHINAQVVDADYVAESIVAAGPALPRSAAWQSARASGSEGSEVEVPLISLDVLDLGQLKDTAPAGGWDLLVDKSTADAISCGPSLPRQRGQGGEEEEDLVEPIHILCDNLASVTRTGGRWLCISYSSSRFDHLGPITHGPGAESASDSSSAWRLVSKIPVDGAYTGEPSTLSDGNGGKRVVYAPETNVWAYVLERK
ncbi:uncharacterized protein MKK02DRAFT_21295 [Dioszegia hungarica]|uniref:Methyltransferase domain-containing protein n=1 Tax=Dioszegia hungarica TaxID=4972 RepID=A0AA38H195_9TREE|nr:uncharacterized protein MKK02DRAFT_21295 [Dioszegia hungarica]KAI9631807.1 hypothetical protein MKK02DRAFT_21295 [Dioszegia hungarica]